MPEPEINLHRDMGRLEGRISSLEHQLSEHRTGMTVALNEVRTDLKAAVTDLTKKLDSIAEHITAGDITDAGRVGAAKAAWWIIGLVASALVKIGRMIGVTLKAVMK